jgi:hypothetical protein
VRGARQIQAAAFVVPAEELAVVSARDVVIGARPVVDTEEEQVLVFVVRRDGSVSRRRHDDVADARSAPFVTLEELRAVLVPGERPAGEDGQKKVAAGAAVPLGGTGQSALLFVGPKDHNLLSLCPAFVMALVTVPSTSPYSAEKRFVSTRISLIDSSE